VAVDGDEEVRNVAKLLDLFILSANLSRKMILIAMHLVYLLQNELAILEFIHSLVETLDKYFESVCELGELLL
jgi:hypothetical protein